MSPGRLMRRDVLVGTVFEREQASLRDAFLGAFCATSLDRINTFADGLTCGLRQLPRLGQGNGVEWTQTELTHATIAGRELKEPALGVPWRDLEPETAAIPVAPWLREL